MGWRRPGVGLRVQGSYHTRDVITLKITTRRVSPNATSACVIQGDKTPCATFLIICLVHLSLSCQTHYHSVDTPLNHNYHPRIPNPSHQPPVSAMPPKRKSDGAGSAASAKRGKKKPPETPAPVDEAHEKALVETLENKLAARAKRWSNVSASKNLDAHYWTLNKDPAEAYRWQAICDPSGPSDEDEDEDEDE